MPVIRLPDGSLRSFDAPVTVADVAMSIGAGSVSYTHLDVYKRQELA